MSQRNGDKARFDRQRKKKSLHRERIRQLRKVLALQNKSTPTLTSKGVWEKNEWMCRNEYSIARKPHAEEHFFAQLDLGKPDRRRVRCPDLYAKPF